MFFLENKDTWNFFLYIFSKPINRRTWNKKYDYVTNHTWKNKEFNLKSQLGKLQALG